MNTRESEIKILKLVVKDRKISAQMISCTAAGKITGSPQELGPTLDLELSKTAERTMDLIVELVRESPQGQVPDQRLETMLELLGEHLYKMLFHRHLENRLDDQMHELFERRLALLRVELQFEGEKGAWLSSLPWEYLRKPPAEDDSDPGGFLATSATQLVLNRLLPPPRLGSRTLPAATPWKARLVSSSPNEDDLTEVDCRRVRKAIVEALGEKIDLHEELITRARGAYRSPRPDSTVNKSAFRYALSNFEPHIVHFIGHGRRKPDGAQSGGGELALVGADGRADWIEDEKIAMWLLGSSNLRLVFLQACESALPDPYLGVSGVAKQIASRGIPAVVAMQYKVQPQIADTFAEGFYAALAAGLTIDLAVKAGRERVEDLSERGQHLGFGLPVLYLRGYEGMVQAIAPTLSGQQRIETVREACPVCGAPVTPTQKFCTGCPLMLSCIKCGTPYGDPFGARCGQCGKGIPPRNRSLELRAPAAVRSARASGLRVSSRKGDSFE